MNHIFLLSGDDFWCSGIVLKCPDNDKNRKEIKCLLMAVPKIFGIGRAFTFLQIFKKVFFVNVHHKMLFQNI